MSNKNTDLAKNTIIIAFGGLSAQMVAFLLLPLYTAYLSTRAYGTVDLIIAYITLLTPVVTVELAMAGFRFLVTVREEKEQKVKVITNVLIASGRILAIFVILSVIALRYIHIPYGYLALLSIVAGSISGVFMQFGRGFGRNKIFAIGGMVTGITAAALTVLFLVVFHMGVKGVLVAGILANIFSALLIFFILGLHHYINFKQRDKEMQKELLRYSWPLVPNGVSWWVINAADRTIIAIFLGLSSNGIYAIAYKFPTAFSSVASFFNLSWTESAAMHINGRDKDKFF